MINLLPPTLTNLKVEAYSSQRNDEIINFPPSLTILKLAEYNSHTKPPAAIGKIPDSVTKLLLNIRIAASSLTQLPSRLAKLRLGHLSELDSFDPKDPATVERIAYLRQVAQKDGFILKERSSPHEYHLWDLLPRTLTKLDLGGNTELETLDAPVWQSIPENLQSLLLWREKVALHLQTLSYLPLETITTELRLPRVTWRDEDIKRLNPLLRKFKCQPGCTWLLTLACVPWVPRNIEVGEWEVDFQRAFRALNDLARRS